MSSFDNPTIEEVREKGRNIRTEAEAALETAQWSAWTPIYPNAIWTTLRDRLLPEQMRRYRSVGSKVTQIADFAVRSEYIVHDSDTGLVTLETHLQETQVAPTRGLPRRAEAAHAASTLIIKNRFPRSDWQPPERDPRPLNEESIAYGMTESQLKWTASVLEQVYELRFNDNGELEEVGSGYGTNFMDDFARVNSVYPIGHITGGNMNLLDSFNNMLSTGLPVGSQS